MTDFAPTFPLTFTTLACSKLADAMNPEPDGSFIRVSVVGGGCSGFKQTLDIDTSFDPEDDIETTLYVAAGLPIEGQITSHAKVRVVCDATSALYLEGTTLDYVNENFHEGFKFVGGKVKSSCGCGSSVAY